QNGLLLPANILAQDFRRLHRGVSTEVADSRQAAQRVAAEEIAAATAYLHAPHDEPGDDASDKPGRDETMTTRAMASSQSHIALRAASACAMDAPSAYSRSPPTGRPRAMRVTLTASAPLTGAGIRASSRCTKTAVASPSRLGFVATITSRTLPFDTRATSANTLRSSGPTPSSGASRPPRTW